MTPAQENYENRKIGKFILVLNEQRKNDVIISNINNLKLLENGPEAEFKEFEPRLKFKPQLKYGWFHLKLYSMFQDLSRRSIETGFL